MVAENATAEPQPEEAPVLVAAAHIEPVDPKGIVRAKTIERWGEHEWPAMEELIQKESGWQVDVWNRQGSGACGLFQSLPCSKVLSVAGSLANVAGQADWGIGYISDRYGTPTNALHFWKHVAPTYDFTGPNGTPDGVADGNHWY